MIRKPRTPDTGLTLLLLLFLPQIATSRFWGGNIRLKKDNAMCDAEESCGERDFLCVTESDLAYLASFHYTYENQIEWHGKRVNGQLQNYPADHEKEEARGKAYWSQEKAGQNKATRHYFEKKPEPKVSLHNLDGWIWKLGVGIA